MALQITMQANDLFVIVRELKKIGILQSNLLSLLNNIEGASAAYSEQQHAKRVLDEMIKRYERFNI